ncbi:MAG: hypothetical protein K2X27_26435 [Candidatus Obscuribacterales bacterium]|nr:hypothetical protein [Candidatus Obscuribacterales bacterium]
MEKFSSATCILILAFCLPLSVQADSNGAAKEVEHYAQHDKSKLLLLRSGQATFERLSLLQSAIEEDGSDQELRIALAETYEKLARTAKPDAITSLHRNALEQWLIVMRNETGEEKNTHLRGISLTPGLWDDEERAARAKRRIKNLAGRLPYPWESTKGFLNKQYPQIQELSTSAKILKATD